MRIQCRQRWQIFQCFYLFSMKLVKVESETYKTQKEAEDRKKEIEYKQSVGKFEVPKCVTLRELLDEYVKIYGLAKWSIPRKYAGIVIISCEAGMAYFMQVPTGVNTEIAAGVGMCVKRRRDISAEFHAGSVSAVISCVLTLWMHHAQ